MYILLILFFTSFFAIIIMVGRKLVLQKTLLEKGQVLSEEEVLFEFEVPHLEKVKHLTIKNMRIFGHASLVTTLRFYIRSTNFLKNKYEEIKIKAKNRNKEDDISGEKKEISKFLKIISDYKRKIRKITHKIEEEEKNS